MSATGKSWRFRDITGQTFGTRTVVSLAEKPGPGGIRMWHAVCTCGAESICRATQLEQYRCLECSPKTNTTHGYAPKIKPTPEYSSWGAMKQRCDNPNHEANAKYGPLGYDPRWAVFENFLADMGERPPGTSIERKDGTKGYSKENCIWGTKEQQSINRNNIRKVSMPDGTVVSLREAAKHYGINYTTVLARLKRGWSLADALTK